MVKKADAETPNEHQAPVQAETKPVEMNEYIERRISCWAPPTRLPPVAEHAMYITINDILLNEGTDHESRQPYEVFINSKSMEHSSGLSPSPALSRRYSAKVAT